MARTVCVLIYSAYHPAIYAARPTLGVRQLLTSSSKQIRFDLGQQISLKILLRMRAMYHATRRHQVLIAD